MKELATAKFDETIEVHVRLGIDPRKSDQNVRGTVALPHGTGRTIRVLAFAQGDKAAEAEAAGADVVGAQDLIERVQGGWLEFDAVVATPDMMAAVGSKLGRVLGPRGMLPNPKSGTVGIDIGAIVRALKAGQIEFRSDKTGVVHAPIGKASFEPDAARGEPRSAAPGRRCGQARRRQGHLRAHRLPELDHGSERAGSDLILGIPVRSGGYPPLALETAGACQA